MAEGEDTLTGGTGEEKLPQLTATEQEAQKWGWKPQEQWDGDPDQWVSAREFVNRRSLFDRINRDKFRIEKLERAVDALVKHNDKVFNAGYQSALQELNAARDHAIQEGDAAAVSNIEQRIAAVQQRAQSGEDSAAVAVAKNQPAMMHPAWEPWLEANPWYQKNSEMHGTADGIARAILSEAQTAGKQVDFSEILDEVGRKIRQRYPEQFGTQHLGGNRNVNKDDKGEGTGSNKNAGTLSRRLKEIESAMDDGEREIMNTLITSTGMTKEKYLKDLEAVERNARRK